jgi:hypothetical protein
VALPANRDNAAAQGEKIQVFKNSANANAKE